MQQTDSNFLSMVQAVLANLKSDKNYWKDESLVVNEVETIETTYNSITSTLNAVSGLDSKGYTVAKNNSFDFAMNSTLKLCKKMSVYARRTNDTALLLLTDHSLYTLSAGMETDAISRCSAIVNKAEALLAELQAYKVTEVELAAIRSFITAFNAYKDERSTVKTTKMVSTQDISEQISLLRKNLTILDEIVEGFIDNDEVIARYKSSRSILKYGKSKTSKTKASTTTAATTTN